jgi:hypothetical protein
MRSISVTAKLAMLLCAVFFLPVPDSACAAVSDPGSPESHGS